MQRTRYRFQCVYALPRLTHAPPLPDSVEQGRKEHDPLWRLAIIEYTYSTYLLINFSYSCIDHCQLDRADYCTPLPSSISISAMIVYGTQNHYTRKVKRRYRIVNTVQNVTSHKTRGPERGGPSTMHRTRYTIHVVHATMHLTRCTIHYVCPMLHVIALDMSQTLLTLET